MIAVADLALESLIVSLTGKTKGLVLLGDSESARYYLSQLTDAIKRRSAPQVARLETAKGLRKHQDRDTEVM